MQTLCLERYIHGRVMPMGYLIWWVEADGLQDTSAVCRIGTGLRSQLPFAALTREKLERKLEAVEKDLIEQHPGLEVQRSTRINAS